MPNGWKSLERLNKKTTAIWEGPVRMRCRWNCLVVLPCDGVWGRMLNLRFCYRSVSFCWRIIWFVPLESHSILGLFSSAVVYILVRGEQARIQIFSSVGTIMKPSSALLLINRQRIHSASSTEVKWGLWGHHAVCVRNNKFRNKWYIFMKFCREVISLKVTSTPHFFIR
jgi:hypothetical protein